MTLDPIKPYITVIRDAAIVAALAFLIYRIYTDGKNAAKVADLKAVQAQITANNAQEAAWRGRIDDAFKTSDTQMDTLATAIATQRTPIIVRGPASACPVSSPPSASPSVHPPGGGADAAAGGDSSARDVRDAINAFELRFEGYLASCRALKEAWPK